VANSPSGDGVVERVVRVLAAFDAAHPLLTASEVGRRTGLPRSSAHRLVRELAAEGLLELDESGAYRIGLRLWELTTRGSRALELRQAALPAMEAVQVRIRQHTQLAVLERGEVLFLERLSHREATSNVTRVAGRLPAHASSSGLVLLADAPEEVREAVLAGPLAPYTPDTPADAASLRRKLAEVRRLGYAANRGFIEPDTAGVAVPVRDEGRTIAALGVVVPREGLDERGLVGVLRQGAEAIGAELRRARARRFGQLG